MNRMTAVLIISVALAPCALAQGPKSLKAIEQQLTQTKSSATAAALIESIAETTPRTDEDVAALGRLLDK